MTLVNKLKLELQRPPSAHPMVCSRCGLCCHILLTFKSFQPFYGPSVWTHILAVGKGSNDVGWQDPTVLSPEIDALAAEGIKLENMYTWDWCAPSRGAFLSGAFNKQTNRRETNNDTRTLTHALVRLPISVRGRPAGCCAKTAHAALLTRVKL